MSIISQNVLCATALQRVRVGRLDQATTRDQVKDGESSDQECGILFFTTCPSFRYLVMLSFVYQGIYTDPR